MPSQNIRHQKKSGKYQPIPELTPLYGVKLYAIESGYIMTFIAIIIYALARLYMCLIENRSAGSFDIFALLGIIGSILLFFGGLFTLLGTHIKTSPGIFAFSGLLLLIFANMLFCAVVAIDTLAETDILGVIQCVLQVLFLLSLLIALIALMISCLNRRIAPGIGTLPAVVSVFSIVLLIFRTLTTYAALASALGSSFSWDYASDLNTEIKWVLRSISTDSDFAADMYYARLFERISLVILMAAIMPLVFRFASFFRQYNMQMRIAAEMPGGLRNVREQHGNMYASGKFDLRSSLQNLREPEKQEEPEPQEEEELDDTEQSEGYCTPDYISGFDEPEELFFAQSERRPEHFSQQPAEPQIIYNTENMLDQNYGMPVEKLGSSEKTETAESSGTSENSADHTGSQRVKVKAKSSIPSPDDESFWNQFTE